MNDCEIMCGKKYEQIIENIKLDYLSSQHFPKLIIGSGSSVPFSYPGMWALGEELNNQLCNSHFKDEWQTIYPRIKEDGLESGLEYLNSQNPLVKEIKRITGKFILSHEVTIQESIYYSNTGLKQLLSYLRDSVSVNNSIIDIMTPNYDLVIETICDSLGIEVITGFRGVSFGKFNPDILENPKKYYQMKRPPNNYVRLFKPHGSLNWLNKKGVITQIRDTQVLLKNSEDIEIITPGGSKFEQSLEINEFRYHREAFNHVLQNDTTCSLVFFGYGFNDKHFDIVTHDFFKNSYTKKNILIISKSVKNELIQEALESENITILYEENDKNYLIYNKRKYITEEALWNIDTFASIFT